MREAGDVGYWQSGLYIEHVATGLFIYGAYGREFLDTFAGFNDQPDHWMVKGGVRERWHPLGHTVLYGAYAERNDMFNEDLDRGRLWSQCDYKHPDPRVEPRCGAGDRCSRHVSGCSTTTSRPRLLDAPVLAALKAVLALMGRCNGPTNGIGLDHMQLVKFGGLINF